MTRSINIEQDIVMSTKLRIRAFVFRMDLANKIFSLSSVYTVTLLLGRWQPSAMTFKSNWILSKSISCLISIFSSILFKYIIFNWLAVSFFLLVSFIKASIAFKRDIECVVNRICNLSLYAYFRKTFNSSTCEAGYIVASNSSIAKIPPLYCPGYLSFNLLNENKAKIILPRLSCPIEFWFQSYKLVDTPKDRLFFDVIAVAEDIGVWVINILLCNSLNSSNSSAVKSVSSVKTFTSSAVGTKRFKLKKIVGKDK